MVASETIHPVRFEDRLTRCRKALSENRIDTFLVLIEENRRYLSGYTGEDNGFDESAGALLISGTRQILLTDSRFELQANEEAPLFEVVCHREGLAKILPEYLTSLHTKRLGFESARLSFSQYNAFTEALNTGNMTVELVGTEDIVESFRVIKAESEIDCTMEALAMAEMDRKQTAGELLTLLTGRNFNEEAPKRLAQSNSLPWNHAPAELRALYALAIQKVTPAAGTTKTSALPAPCGWP